MNICFLKGKVLEEVEFKFLMQRKNTSIAKTKIELDNKSIVTVNGYNEMADCMYQNIKKEDCVYIQGRINSEMEIEVFWLKI